MFSRFGGATKRQHIVTFKRSIYTPVEERKPPEHAPSLSIPAVPTLSQHQQQTDKLNIQSNLISVPHDTPLISSSSSSTTTNASSNDDSDSNSNKGNDIFDFPDDEELSLEVKLMVASKRPPLPKVEPKKKNKTKKLLKRSSSSTSSISSNKQGSSQKDSSSSQKKLLVPVSSKPVSRQSSTSKANSKTNSSSSSPTSRLSTSTSRASFRTSSLAQHQQQAKSTAAKYPYNRPPPLKEPSPIPVVESQEIPYDIFDFDPNPVPLPLHNRHSSLTRLSEASYVNVKFESKPVMPVIPQYNDFYNSQRAQLNSSTDSLLFSNFMDVAYNTLLAPVNNNYSPMATEMSTNGSYYNMTSSNTTVTDINTDIVRNDYLFSIDSLFNQNSAMMTSNDLNDTTQLTIPSNLINDPEAAAAVDDFFRTVPQPPHIIPNTYTDNTHLSQENKPQAPKRKRNLVAHLKSANGEEYKPSGKSFNYSDDDEDLDQEIEETKDLLPITEVITNKDRSLSPELSYKERMELELQSMMNTEFGGRESIESNVPEQQTSNRPRYKPQNKLNVRVTFSTKKRPQQ